MGPARRARAREREPAGAAGEPRGCRGPRVRRARRSRGPPRDPRRGRLRAARRAGVERARGRADRGARDRPDARRACPRRCAGLDGKTLVGGVVDGRNIWRGDLAGAWAKLDELARARRRRGRGRHVDLAAARAARRRRRARPRRATALVARLRRPEGRSGDDAGPRTRGRSRGDRRRARRGERRARRPRGGAGRVRRRRARAGGGAVARGDRTRSSTTSARRRRRRRSTCPFLPTTTIGSFPQTAEIRRTRARHDRGELSTREYEDLLRFEITTVIGLQEELGLDVLVHGEPERNDMVQYFAENLDGFAVTRNGWVQSYGSRATRPSILWGDVSRPAPITVEWSRFAQSLTEKPVKGMLTGPVTILAWSFVRDDQPLGDHRRPGRARAARRGRATSKPPASGSSRSTSPRCASCCRSRGRIRARTSTGRSDRSASPRPGRRRPRRSTRTSATRSSAR